MTHSILVIDNYDSFTWNLVHYLEESGARTEVIRNDEMSAEHVLEAGHDGLVLSPGPCTPNEAGICVELVRRAPPNLPILGVCLGHQSIAAAEGGTIVTAQQIRHGKISHITHKNGPLFSELPSSFDVVRYHSLSIQIDTFPSSLIADAHTEDGEIMAIRHVSRPVYGVQFHPESILTEHGHKLLRNWLDQFP